MSVERVQGCPDDRHVSIGDPLEDRLVGHERGHRLAAVAHDPVGERRLVLARLVDPVAVLAGDVGGRQDPHEIGMAREQRAEVADREASARVRRADRANREHRLPRSGRPRIGAEFGLPGDPRDAVDLGQARPDGGPGGRVGCGDGAGATGRGRRRDRLDDLAVAGAPAEDAAQRVMDLGLAGLGVAGEQVVGGHEHPRRADAALGGPGLQEGSLEGAQRVELTSAVAGVARRAAPASPSTVRTSPPAAWAIGTRQAHTWRPSSRTVQAPQSPASQPTFVPVRPRSSRRTSDEATHGVDLDLDGLAVDREVDPRRHGGRLRRGHECLEGAGTRTPAASRR